MLYFAYGSLVNQDRIRELCPKVKPLRTAKIPDHSLCFTGHSDVWGGGTATIGLAPNRDLWGGLYEIDGPGRIAVVSSGEDDGYVWATTSVEDVRGAEVATGMLIKVRDLERIAPSERYLDVLRVGWKQWGIDAEAQLRDALPAE